MKYIFPAHFEYTIYHYVEDSKKYQLVAKNPNNQLLQFNQCHTPGVVSDTCRPDFTGEQTENTSSYRVELVWTIDWLVKSKSVDEIALHLKWIHVWERLLGPGAA